MISPPLLALIAILIAVAGFASWMLLRTSQHEKDVAVRLEAVSANARPRAAVVLPSITKRDSDAHRDWRETLAGLLGFSLKCTDQYTLAWPWVIVIALVSGRLAVWLGSGMFGPLAWVMMPVVSVAMSRSFFNSMVTKRVTALRNQLPEAIGLVVRAARVGVPVSEALKVVAREAQAPTSIEFARLTDQLNIGATLESALRDMADRNKMPEYGFLAAALTLQAQTGGALAETLELLADVTRKRVAMQARGHALSAEARTSSMILGALPVVSGIGIYFINPDYIGVLFTDPSGQMVLGGAVLSLCVGMFVMRTIIRSALKV